MYKHILLLSIGLQFRAIAAALVAFLGMSLSTAARAEWLLIETPRFTVYSEVNKQDTLEYVNAIHQQDSVLRVLLAIGDSQDGFRQLPILLFRSRETMDRLLGDDSSGILGFFRPSLQGSYATAIYQKNDVAAGTRSRAAVGAPTFQIDNLQVLRHEYTHYFVNNHFRSPLPLWFQEGIASYAETIDEVQRGARVGNVNRARSATLAFLDWMAMDRLFSAGRGALSREETSLLYAQGWLLTHYLFSNGERLRQFGQYLAAVQTGKSSKEAAIATFGEDLNDLEKKLKVYHASPLEFRILKKTAPLTEADVKITKLPNIDGDFLVDVYALRAFSVEFGDERQKQEQALQSKQAEREEARYRRQQSAAIERVRANFDKYSDPRRAKLLLARAEIFANNFERAVQLVDEVISSEANDAEAWFLKGLATYATSRAGSTPDKKIMAKALDFFYQAYDADPNNVENAYYLGESVFYLNPKAEDAVIALSDAFKKSPEVAPISLRLGEALAAQGKSKEALMVIEPIAYQPHAGFWARIAESMVDLIRSHSDPNTGVDLAAAWDARFKDAQITTNEDKD